MSFKDLNLKKEDVPYLTIVFLFSFILVFQHIIFNVNLGIYCSDVFVYLLNALYFTGENIRSATTIYLSPIICFLTSILFRIGIKGEIAIFIVTGIFAIIGNVGLYTLLKIRFNKLLSLLGVVIFSSFSLNLLWLGNGSLDIPAVSLTMWIIVFLIASVNKNPKYYLVLFPLFTIGFFTRFTVILILPIMFLYYIYSKDINRILKISNIKEFHNSEEFKYILKGILISLIITVIIVIPIIIMSSNLGYYDQTIKAIGGNKGSLKDNAYNTDLGFYISNFPNFLSSSKTIFISRIPYLESPSPISSILIGIMILGTGISIKNNFKKISKEKINLKYLLVTLLILTIAIGTFTKVSSAITILLMLIILLLINILLKKYEFTYINLNLLFIGWLLIYLIFFSYINIKVDRYFIPILPVVSYFIISSIYLIQEKINILNGKILPILLIIIFIGASFGFVSTVEDTNEFKNQKDLSNYLINYDSNYKNETIGAYNVRAYGWYLEEYIEAIPSNNTSTIDKNNITYYISDVKLNNLSNYSEVKNIDKLYLYEKIRY